MPVSRYEFLDTLAQVGRALGNGHRLALLERLAQSEATVERLAEAGGLSVPNASQHLQQLRRGGLVTAQREGRQMRYRLTDERIVTLLALLQEIAESNLAEMERLVGQLFSGADAGGALEPMTRRALLASLQRGDVVLLDVRPGEEYAHGHVPGAVNIPLEELEQRLDELPAGQEVVAYCRGPYCLLAVEAVALLRRQGRRARRLEEGFPEWRAAGGPVEGRG